MCVLANICLFRDGRKMVKRVYLFGKCILEIAMVYNKYEDVVTNLLIV